MLGKHPEPILSKQVESRLNLFSFFVVALVLLLTVRLGYLQFVRGEEFQRLSEGNRIRLLPITAPRGEMYDRHGRVLVSNRPAYTVSLVHMGSADTQHTITRLAGILGMSPAEIEKEIAKKQQRLFEPVRLKTDIDNRTHTILEELKIDLPGLVIEDHPVRQYIYGDMLGHVLGYVGKMDKKELEKYRDKGYSMGDMIGKTGLEKAYEEYLKGKDGGEQVEVDAIGNPIRVLGLQESVPGNNLHLTIDADLQRVAERALEENMLRVQSGQYGELFPHAKAGAVVVLDPRNGDVLAMVSRPAFDPNLFAVGISEEDWLELSGSPLKHLTNRTTSMWYPPGSTFKMVTAVAALQTGKVTPEEVLVDPGVYHVTSTTTKKCWRAHGPVDIYRAIAYSCNVFFYEMGRRVGIDALAGYAQQFGLGRLTGIDLPDEKAGIVPTPQWKKERYEAHAPGIRDPYWWPAETADAAIGQGFHTYTPLQMATYVAAIASGGDCYVPRLVREIRSPDGRVLKEFPPEARGTLDVSAQVLEIVRRAMVGTCRPGGTAGWIFADFPVEVAGKTGTAQQTQDAPYDDHAWFVGFAPANEPQIAFAVLMEQGGHGSTACAPVAREILDHFFGLATAPPGPAVPKPPGAGD